MEIGILDHFCASFDWSRRFHNIWQCQNTAMEFAERFKHVKFWWRFFFYAIWISFGKIFRRLFVRSYYLDPKVERNDKIRLFVILISCKNVNSSNKWIIISKAESEIQFFFVLVLITPVPYLISFLNWT